MPHREAAVPPDAAGFCFTKGQSGMKHGNRSKRQALKSASTDLGTSDVGK